MDKIVFNDGTPPMEVKKLVVAETVIACKDANNLYYLINRDRVEKQAKEDEDEDDE